VQCNVCMWKGKYRGGMGRAQTMAQNVRCVTTPLPSLRVGQSDFSCCALPFAVSY